MGINSCNGCVFSFFRHSTILSIGNLQGNFQKNIPVARFIIILYENAFSGMIGIVFQSGVRVERILLGVLKRWRNWRRKQKMKNYPGYAVCIKR